MARTALNQTARRGRPPTKQTEAASELAMLLSQYIQRDGRTLNIIAQSSLIDVGYLWHLQAGTKARPSRDVLIRLGLALKLEPEDLDELLIAAEFAPITARRA